MSIFGGTQVIHVDDVGVELIIQIVDQDGVAVDVSTATTREITIQQPDGTDVVRAADFPDADEDFTGDGTDGFIRILSEAGDFPEASPRYQIQGHVVVAGLDVRSKVRGFEVKANI